MKILITLITLISLILASQSFAGCPDMAKKSVSKYKKSNTVTFESYSKFYLAIKHYRYQLENDPTFKPYIQETNVYIKGGKLSGFEVFVTDGGDESTVRYVFNENKKLVVAYWYNQSPMTMWFCGESTEVGSEETIDGRKFFLS